MATLHTPTEGTSGAYFCSASVTSPLGLVKFTSSAPGASFLHIRSDVEDDRDGAQCLCHTSDAGGLLPDQAVTPAQVFIRAARLHLPNAQLRGYICRSFNRRPLVGGQHHRKWRSFGTYHTLSKPAYNFQPLGIDILQPQFVKRKWSQFAIKIR